MSAKRKPHPIRWAERKAVRRYKLERNGAIEKRLDKVICERAPG